MTDFLRQLAARALDLNPVVQPRINSVYGAELGRGEIGSSGTFSESRESVIPPELQPNSGEALTRLPRLVPPERQTWAIAHLPHRINPTIGSEAPVGSTESSMVIHSGIHSDSTSQQLHSVAHTPEAIVVGPTATVSSEPASDLRAEQPAQPISQPIQTQNAATTNVSTPSIQKLKESAVPTVAATSPAIAPSLLPSASPIAAKGFPPESSPDQEKLSPRQDSASPSIPQPGIWSQPRLQMEPGQSPPPLSPAMTGRDGSQPLPKVPEPLELVNPSSPQLQAPTRSSNSESRLQQTEEPPYVPIVSPRSTSPAPFPSVAPLIATVPSVQDTDLRSPTPTDPPTINITIGRIEVRTIAPAAPPRPRSIPTPPRLSLEAYLKSRNGGSG